MNKGPFSWENGLGDLSGLHRLSLLKRGFFDFEIGSNKKRAAQMFAWPMPRAH
jgi:hypothetical protein